MLRNSRECKKLSIEEQGEEQDRNQKVLKFGLDHRQKTIVYLANELGCDHF